MGSVGRTGQVLAVAAGDLLWIALLLPMAAAFQSALVLARGYYFFRHRGIVAAGAYVLAVAGLVGVVIRKLRQ